MRKMDYRMAMAELTRLTLLSHLDELIELIREERDLAGTHSQRNAYQQVLRTRIESIKNQVSVANTTIDFKADDVTDIPF